MTTQKKTVVATSFILAMGFSLPGFAGTKTVEGDAMVIECITAAEV